MHVAICDDNVADRRQLERLLKRESDKRSARLSTIGTQRCFLLRFCAYPSKENRIRDTVRRKNNTLRFITHNIKSTLRKIVNSWEFSKKVVFGFL